MSLARRRAALVVLLVGVVAASALGWRWWQGTMTPGASASGAPTAVAEPGRDATGTDPEQQDEALVPGGGAAAGPRPVAEPRDSQVAEAGTPEATATQPVGSPRRVEIPAIGVDAKIVPVGLRPDGAMEVPDFGFAGWYTEGPPPGEEGPSTVVAHVDSRAGPDVFSRLSELRPGDEVRILGEDGSVVFVVEHSERASKDELPTKRIWGWTEEPTLRLITCDGLFDRSTGHYVDNLIVYLALANAPDGQR